MKFDVRAAAFATRDIPALAYALLGLKTEIPPSYLGIADPVVPTAG